MIDVERRSPPLMSSMKRKDFSINPNVESWGHRMAQFYHYSQIILRAAGSEKAVGSVLGIDLESFVQHFREANRDLPIWVRNHVFQANDLGGKPEILVLW
jgi:hypothetical protein